MSGPSPEEGPAGRSPDPATRRILHLSDVHFGPPHAPEVARGVVELAARGRPDLVVISGDLTQRAKPHQFHEARRFVDEIEGGLGIATLCVPGNHDVPLYRFWERALDPLGAYRRHFSAELEPLYRDPRLLVVGVNTATNWTLKHGRITRRRLRQVEELLASAAPEQTKVLVAHHQLVPAPSFGSQRVVANAHDAMELFSRLGVEVVLSGHLHQAYVVRSEAYFPLRRRPLLIVHSGTSTSHRGRGMERHRQSCNWITVEEERLTVGQLVWEPELGRFLERSRHLYPRRFREPYGLSLDGGAAPPEV